MPERIIKCPVCNEPVQFNLTEDAVIGKEFPVPCIIYHGDHPFIAYLDSELNLCDVEKPYIIRSK
ncbi:MAG: hypothetical protein ACTSYB_14875 [Candidatus Helarchaeota archaeon]